MERAIEGYENALIVYTQTDFPVDWAMTQNNLASAYSNRIRGDRAQNLERAIEGYENALIVRTQTDFPIECLQTSRNLGNLGFTQGNWQLAISAYQTAVTAVETSRSWATNDDRRQEIIAQAIDVYERLIQAFVKLGQIDKAIEYTERSRSRRLVDLMASNDLYSDGEIPLLVQQYLQQFQQLQQQIDAERNSYGSDNEAESRTVSSSTRSNREALEQYSEIIQQLEAQKQIIWAKIRQLDPILAGEIKVDAPDLATMQKLIDRPDTAILNFYSTDEDTYIFILFANRPPQLHICQGQGQATLQNWIFENWLVPYVENRAEWAAKLSSLLNELSQYLQIETLIAQHLAGIEELIIIPHLYLHQIPFAALPINYCYPTATSVNLDLSTVTYLGDKYRIRYIPSCQILKYCQDRSPVFLSDRGTVEDADDTLVGARIEGEKIAQMLAISPEYRLVGKRQATVSNYRQVVRQVNLLHSSHHASSNLLKPLESQLLLADGRITLGELMTPAWRFPKLVDVFLSCCETNLGLTKITDDILTLATGFLCAGARSVCSTLWTANDIASAIFSLFYYQFQQQNYSRTQSLQQAQIKLRNLTGIELQEIYQREFVAQYQQTYKDLRQAKANRDREMAGTDAYLQAEEKYQQLSMMYHKSAEFKKALDLLGERAHPFAHPDYWSVFIISGLS
ncbi:hypothetical protein C7B64_21285 [Merismopedia glauca CCAP 1448/3]|uniref:CHAT domain-containing protein n=1 Tax=Merismopedia glauca CCAP 1448/3 TaxID=1296344 RepID=A0A2T1BXY3_9CYAN|nr:hypothetical protein C7B64_21285 [Merismopedia glauca CCAP 1448/3]